MAQKKSGLSERLVELRKKHQHTQDFVAKSLGASLGQVNRWEAGTAVPRQDHLDQLAELYGVSVGYLLRGESSTPPAGQPFEKRMGTIAEHLVRLGLPRHQFFLERRLPSHVVAIDDIQALCTLNGHVGLAPSRIITTVRNGIATRLPGYVYERKRTTPPPEDNNPIALITRWKDALSDKGGDLRIEFTTERWHMKLAMEDCTARLQRDIQTGEVEFGPDFPGYMTISITVETTQDNKLLLCQRTPQLHDEPGRWSFGIGETMRPDEDFNPALGVHPLNTVNRGLEQEIGLPTSILSDATVSFLHLGLSAQNWAFNLFSHVEVNTDIKEVLQCLATRPKDNEHRVASGHGVDFTIGNCGSLLVAPQYRRDDHEKPAAIASWSKLGLLYAAIRKFGTTPVIEKLASLEPILNGQ